MALAYKQLFDNNKVWVEKMNKENPEFFDTLAKGQSPQYLWIGCSDSRVPANEVTMTSPGDIFVHRNIANMVVHTDMNMLSVLDYSVNVLKVRHVLVVGHYGCGGVKAAMGSNQVGLIDNWLRHIKDVYRLNMEELDSIEDADAKCDRFVELNVKEQVFNLAKTSIVQNAWQEGRFLQIHGIVYSIENGILQDLNCSLGDNQDLAEVYRFAPSNGVKV